MAVIEKHLGEYDKWRSKLHDAIKDFQSWLLDQELGDAQIDDRLSQVLASLRDDKLYVAFVAEFSRGKSELINAIFFADFGQRVLPSSAGRTTMCPTELEYNRGTKPHLKLLPIETRSSGTTITEFKNFEDEWVVVPLLTKNADKMAKSLHHIVETIDVTKEMADKLSFHVGEEGDAFAMPLTDEGLVTIPKWRHAIINYPHPMLDQGLVILDTPGLNALGAEPELTLNMLPSAHAILFILAADAGVTKSDIQVWHDHIGAHKGANKGRLVVLNKIDGLWDELRDWDDVQKEIDKQIRETAKLLKIPEHNVYPVSAQKGLYAKIKKDDKILKRSRITELEEALGTEMIPAKREIVSDNIRDDMSHIIKAMRLLVAQRLKGVYEHINELGSLNGKNMDVIEHMMDKVKKDKDVFEKSLQRFQAARSIFSQQTNVLYSQLNLRNLDKVIAETKKDMQLSMTTGGLKTCMNNFFRMAKTTMEDVSKQAQEIKELMDGIYKKFQKEHGLLNIKPGNFSVMRYLREIKRLETRHEQFVKGMTIFMTEQKAVTNKFFESSVAKVRAIYKMANRDADNWLKNIMSPMESQVREHQIQLRRRLESIKRIHQASDTLEDRLGELEHISDGILEQEKSLQKKVGGILQSLEITDEKKEKEINQAFGSDIEKKMFGDDPDFLGELEDSA
ncbi:MAG: dynamin-like GTPase family protein [Gammaproteobacteria bacterium]|nr:MAG: dynamin-like GTPase family protein [Gammaproteobacteria bacterium]